MIALKDAIWKKDFVRNNITGKSKWYLIPLIDTGLDYNLCGEWTTAEQSGKDLAEFVKINELNVRD